MSPALIGSTALQRFKHGNMVEIHNGIMFRFLFVTATCRYRCGTKPYEVINITEKVLLYG